MESHRFSNYSLLPLWIALILQHIVQTIDFIPINEVVGLDLAPLELLLQISMQHILFECLLADLLQLQVVVLVLLPIGHLYLFYQSLELFILVKHQYVDWIVLE